jgi:hypothetical protein
MIPKNPDTPWIGFFLSDEHLREIGHLIAQWAYYEMELNSLLSGLRMAPEALALTETVHSSYNKRAKLLRQTALVCFPNCNELAKRIARITFDAVPIKQYRDRITHGTWSIDRKGIVSAMLEKDGKYNRQEISVPALKAASIQISALSREIGAVIRGGLPFEDFSFRLSPEEKAALRDFRLRNRPIAPILNKSSDPQPS